MRFSCLFCLLLTLLPAPRFAQTLTAEERQPPAAQLRFFEEHVRPLLATRCVHGLSSSTLPAGAPIVTPQVRSATFQLGPEAYAQRAAGELQRSHVYTRETNPTIEAVEAHLAALEGAERSLLFSSGMAAIHATGYANADMIRAIGSLVTRKYEGSFGWGLAIHLVSGMLFAIPYTVVLCGLGPMSLAMSVGLGGLMGLVHGLVMSLVLLGLVTERHPMKRFQNAGFEVAVAHIVGHVAYGIGVGAVAYALTIDCGLRLT